MSYAAALVQLQGLGAELAPPAPGTARAKFDLQQMRCLMAALGDPQRHYPSVLIAGTNGKGSTAAMLASMLSCAGYRTGLYTSPHLQRINERIQISDKTSVGVNTLAPVSDQRFGELYLRVAECAEALVKDGSLPHRPSFFEVLTSMAFVAFAEGQIEIAILEVGLGGRLDATNIVDPILSVITDIALDHTEWLGSTLAEIAREKAGILRQGGTMAILPQHPEVNAAIGEVAVNLNVTGINAADYMAGGSAALAALTSSSQVLPLQGKHQERNAALAVASACYLEQSKRFIGLDRTSIKEGLRQVHWPGRLETVRLPRGLPMLLDVAHNPAGAWALRAYLSQAISSGKLPAPRMLIFSAYRDKAIREMAQILFPLFGEPGDSVALVLMDGPRAASKEELLAIADSLEVPVTLFSNVGDALATADGTAFGSTVVTGSVHLIGDVKQALHVMEAGWNA